MRNDKMISRVVAEALSDRDWLRFVATANLPHRPNGFANGNGTVIDLRGFFADEADELVEALR